jgi:oligopeptide transport system substrate-binding protein
MREIGLSYDLDEAKLLLREAGYPEGSGLSEIELMIHTDPLSSVVAENLQTQWQANLGVEIVWRVEEWAAYLHRMSACPPSMFLWAWGADYPDPDNVLRVSALQQRCRWSNERYAELLEQAGRGTDQSERIHLYQQADRLLVDQAIVMPLVYHRFHLLVKPWVARYPVSPVGYGYWKDALVRSH